MAFTAVRSGPTWHSILLNPARTTWTAHPWLRQCARSELAQKIQVFGPNTHIWSCASTPCRPWLSLWISECRTTLGRLLPWR